jgi:trk system potassium uptake protein TrkA
MYQLLNGRVEALEFAAKKELPFYNKPLKEINLKKGCLIGCIIRQNEVIIPNGNSEIRLGDNVVVVTTHKNFDDLNDVFE